MRDLVDLFAFRIAGAGSRVLVVTRGTVVLVDARTARVLDRLPYR